MRSAGAIIIGVLAACALWLGGEPRQAHAIAPAAVCVGPQVVACAAVGRAAAVAAARGATRVGRAIAGRVRGGSSRAPRSGKRRVGRTAAGAAAVAGAIGFEALTGGISEGASWLIRQTIAALDDSARVDLRAGWFADHYALMGALAAFLLLPLLLVSLTMSLVRGDWPAMVRASLLYVPASIFLTAAVVTVTQAALAAVDAFSADLADDVAGRSGDIAATAGTLGLVGGVPAFVAMLVGLVMSLAALAVWLELVLRAAAIYVAVAFAPLFFAGIVWPRLQSWAGELARLLVALVLSKLVIVSVLSLGLTGITELDGVSGVVSGAAIFGLAAFAPFVLLSLLPLASGIGAGVGVQARSAIGEAGGLRRVWHNAQRHMGSPVGEMQPATAGGPKAGGAGAATSRPSWTRPTSDPHEQGGRVASRPAAGGGASARVSESATQRILQASRHGSSPREIAQELDDAGVPTPRGGKRWSPSTVQRVIAREHGHAERPEDGGGGPTPSPRPGVDPQRPEPPS